MPQIVDIDYLSVEFDGPSRRIGHNYRSPGHQVDAGSLAEILDGRNATR
jgi:hypothetical protein